MERDLVKEGRRLEKMAITALNREKQGSKEHDVGTGAVEKEDEDDEGEPNEEEVASVEVRGGIETGEDEGSQTEDDEKMYPKELKIYLKMMRLQR
ncbi:hypothetical protein U1Q18_037761 [Sarracenia purpurea var. burkii]